MTSLDFSNEFDILFNSISSNKAPSLDEYEKSVFLTKAQESLIINLYNGNNPFGASFESTEALKEYLKELIVTKQLNSSTVPYPKVSEKSVFFTLPEDILFVTYESVIIKASDKCSKQEATVSSITQEDYDRIKNNPFKKDNKSRILRLVFNKNTYEVITEYPIINYTIKYIKKPNPIILSDLTGLGVSIDGKTEETPCELNTILHRTILENAVNLAYQVYFKAGN